MTTFLRVIVQPKEVAVNAVSSVAVLQGHLAATVV